MPKMSDINEKNSRFFKMRELEEITGKPWQAAQAILTVASAYVDEYPSVDGKPGDVGYFLTFAGQEKPLGVNWTNRVTLENMVGDVEWETATLAGLRLLIYAEQTSMGPGIRIRPAPELRNDDNLIQQSSAAARARINRAQSAQSVRTSPMETGTAPPAGDPIRDSEPIEPASLAADMAADPGPDIPF